nr:alpha/beta fold hydrolase [uncultured Albidiferax sp.]
MYRYPWPALLAALAGLLLAAPPALAQTPYADRFQPNSGAPLHPWKDASGKDKPFSRYLQDAQDSIARYHYALPPGSPLPDEPLARAVGPREWPLQGQNCSAGNTDGILLVHGLSDSPYLVRDLGDVLSRQPIAAGRCVLVRSLLLPGNATTPGDLLRVRYEDWVEATGYGLRSFAGAAARVHLVGYSTGGALGIYWAYHPQELQPRVPLASLVLLSPVVRPTGFITRLSTLPDILARLVDITGYKRWLSQHLDQDFAKYESFPLNAGYQVVRLDNALEALLEQAPIPVPVYMALSRNDATVNAKDSIQVFLRSTDPRNRMLLAAPQGKASSDDAVQAALVDARVSVVDAVLPAQSIVDIAHTATTIAPSNRHYGPGGAYAQCMRYTVQPLDASPAFCACITPQMRAAACSTQSTAAVQYGEALPKNFPTDTALRRLTFNPYFDRMAGEIQQFLGSVGTP